MCQKCFLKELQAIKTTLLIASYKTISEYYFPWIIFELPFLEFFKSIRISNLKAKKIKNKKKIQYSFTTLRSWLVFFYLRNYQCETQTNVINLLRKEYIYMKQLYGPFLWIGFNSLKATEPLQGNFSQKFLVFIWSTLKEWKAESSLEPLSASEHRTLGLGI